MSASARKLNELAQAHLASTPNDLSSMKSKLEELNFQIERFTARKEDAMWAGDNEKANGISYQIILRQVARKELKRRIKVKTKESGA